MIKNIISINGVCSIIAHYNEWMKYHNRPLIYKNEGCLFIEKYPTFIISNNEKDYREYDLKFDMLHRCDNILVEILKSSNDCEDKKCECENVNKLKEEICKIDKKYYLYIKKLVFEYY